MEMIEAIKLKYSGLSEQQLVAVIARLMTENGLLRATLYGGRSERRKVEPENMKPLFDEFEDEATAPASEASDDTDCVPEKASSEPDSKARKRGGRKPLPDRLARVPKIIDLPESEKVCSVHCIGLEKIGEDIVEKLEVQPAKAYVLQLITPRYKCPCCDAGIVHAAREPDPIPKSFASPGLLALIATQKYVDGLPLFRQEYMFERAGIDLNRTTMARWMVKMGNVVQPLVNLMHEDLLSTPVVHVDETTVQVLSEPNRDPEAMSYMWCMARQGQEPIVLFKYHPSRNKNAALDLLIDYKGTAVCDGYRVYDSVSLGLGCTLAACMAHIRRKFWQAEKIAKKEVHKDADIKASEALSFIKKLYAIEDKVKGEPPDIVLAARQKNSVPLLEAFFRWLEHMETVILPSSPTGKAVRYALDQWPKMLTYSRDGNVPIDNNYMENHIRPFVVGRKNWLFSQSQSGAHASAAIYSLVESAKANAVDPFEYLTLIFKELPRSPTLDKLDCLLPHKVRSHYQLKGYVSAAK